MASPVTVLLPVYNGQPYLAESVESILHQSFTNFELLIIDDASTDTSAVCIAKYQDSRMRVIRHQKNQGLIASLNHGLAEARHDLIARHDQDDVAYPERLALQTEFMDRHQEVGVCGTEAYVFENGKRTTKVVFPASDSMIRWTLPFYSPLIHPSIMYRRSLIHSVGGYSTSPEADYAEDYDLWCKLLPFTKFHNIQVPLMDLRKHQSSMTVSKKDYHIKQTINITKKLLDRLAHRDIPIELIHWLRGSPTNQPVTSSRLKLIIQIYLAFILQNRMPMNELVKITTNAAKLTFRAMRADLRS